MTRFFKNRTTPFDACINANKNTHESVLKCSFISELAILSSFSVGRNSRVQNYGLVENDRFHFNLLVYIYSKCKLQRDKLD